MDNTNGHDYLIKGKEEYHKHDNLKELNELNTELYINNIKYKYKKYFKPDKEGIYIIILNFNNISIKDCSFMFCNCMSIIDIDTIFLIIKI